MARYQITAVLFDGFLHDGIHLLVQLVYVAGHRPAHPKAGGETLQHSRRLVDRATGRAFGYQLLSRSQKIKGATSNNENFGHLCPMLYLESYIMGELQA